MIAIASVYPETIGSILIRYDNNPVADWPDASQKTNIDIIVEERQRTAKSRCLLTAKNIVHIITTTPVKPNILPLIKGNKPSGANSIITKKGLNFDLSNNSYFFENINLTLTKPTSSGRKKNNES